MTMDTRPELTFRPFDAQSVENPYTLGSDALLYVMAYGHTISVPTTALYWAEKVAILSIARRDTPEPVLRDVNRAIDIIAQSLRVRAKLDAEELAQRDEQPLHPEAPKPAGGQRAKLIKPVPVLPPSGVANPF